MANLTLHQPPASPPRHATSANRPVPTAAKAEAAEVANVVGYRPGLGSLIQTEQ